MIEITLTKQLRHVTTKTKHQPDFDKFRMIHISFNDCTCKLFKKLAKSLRFCFIYLLVQVFKLQQRMWIL